MSNEKKTIVLAFGNMKGGVGKSTLNSVFANFIHNDTDESVCLVDCDDMQKSLFRKRERDRDKLLEKIETELKSKTEGERKEIFDAIWDNRYDLLKIDSVDFPQQYFDILEGQVDYVLVDLPGNLKQKGVIASYALCDFIFMPTCLSDDDLDSTILFHEMYKTEIEPLRIEGGMKPAIIHSVLNKVNKNTTMYKDFVENKGLFPFEFLKTEFPNAEAVFQKNSSTIESFSFVKKEGKEDVDQIVKFCNEVVSIIKSNS